MHTRSIVSVLAVAGSLMAALGPTALGCGASGPAIPRTAGAAKPGAKHDAKSGQSRFTTSLLVEVPEGTVGPYIAYGRDRALALFTVPSQTQRHWWTRAVDANGVPRGTSQKVAQAPADPAFAVVRPLCTGFVALWAELSAQGTSVRALLLDANGAATSDVADVPAAGQVLWIEAFDAPRGPLILWAEQHQDRAAVKAARVGKNGVREGPPFTITISAAAWQAAATPTGAAVAFVSAPSGSALGTVSLIMVNADGQPAPAQLLWQSATAQPDVDLTATGDRLVVAWTDRQNADSRVRAVAVDLQGKVLQGPLAPLIPSGDQALLSLLALDAGGAPGVLVAYEDLPSSSRARRTVRLATLRADLSRMPQQAAVDFAPTGRSVTELAASRDGYVVLTSAQSCPDAPGCPDPVEIPWYVRLSSTHQVTAGAPMLLDALQPSVPAMVWSPGCTATRCMALAAGAGKAPQVVIVRLPEGEERPGVPARGEPAPSPPWVESNDTVRVVDGPLSALAATQLGPTTFFASITHFEEGLAGPADRPSPKAPGDPSKPTAARLEVLRLDAQGWPLGEPTLVSVRAMSIGGVALAPAPAGAQEVCVAWVARDFGEPQVFLTRVGADGKTKLQRMLTRSRGDASDVAIAAYKTGYIVAWVDWRDGNGEVYATLVNQALLRTGPEVRLTNAPGDASDVSLLVRGEQVIVAYGDPRDDARVAAASPYVQKLSLPSLARAGSEVRVQAHKHAKGVSLRASGEDVVLAWNEDALADVDGTAGSGPRLGRLDAGTLQPIEVAGIPIRGAGTAAALGVTCSDGICRGAITVRRSDVSTIDAFSWSAQGPRAPAQTIARLNGASGVEVAPALAGDAMLFVDQGLDGGVRVRRAAVRWSMP